jgi:hypothetical protein
VLPRRIVAERARTRQSQVREMQTVEVTLEIAATGSFIGERTLYARFEGVLEDVPRQRPALGAGIPVQSIEQRAF